MDKEFWLDKWERNDTKFNQIQVNQYLIKYKNIFESLKGKNIFVPLCGKSIDLLWFLKQGAKIVGVELSTIAIESFFAENNLIFKKIDASPFVIYESEFLKIFCGDLFQLDKNEVGDIDWIYDRASLIALDEKTRVQYANKISQLSSNWSKMFLIAMSCQTASPELPPYSVTNKDVHSLFSKDFQVELLSQDENMDVIPQLKQRGYTDINDSVYLLKKLK